MKKEKNVRDLMFEYIQAGRNEELKQGDLLKQIADSQMLQQDYINDAYAMGHNYFTDDKLELIAGEAKTYLARNLDVESLKTKINDDTHTDTATLEELYALEEKIRKVKCIVDNSSDTTNSNSDITNKTDNSAKKKNNVVQAFLIDFVDSINGGDEK